MSNAGVQTQDIISTSNNHASTYQYRKQTTKMSNV